MTLATLGFQAIGASPDDFDAASHALSESISQPDFFAFFVAFCAGIAGVLSLTAAKSGALIGVLISVTTIPAAANVGVAAAYGEMGLGARLARPARGQRASLIVAGTLTLARRPRVLRRGSAGTSSADGARTRP